MLTIHVWATATILINMKKLTSSAVWCLLGLKTKILNNIKPVIIPVRYVRIIAVLNPTIRLNNIRLIKLTRAAKPPASINHNAIENLYTWDSIFPLIVNTDIEASEVLKTYKSQPYLEKRMDTVKSILNITPVFLKKQRRIEAITFLYFIALMIVGLMEPNVPEEYGRGKCWETAYIAQRHEHQAPDLE